MSRTKPVSLLTTRNLSSSKFLKISWQEFRSRDAGTESGLHNCDKNPGGCSTFCSPSGSSLSKSLLQCGFLVHFRVSAAPLFISRLPRHLCSFPDHCGTSVHFQITAAPLFISKSPQHLCSFPDHRIVYAVHSCKSASSHHRNQLSGHLANLLFNSVSTALIGLCQDMSAHTDRVRSEG